MCTPRPRASGRLKRPGFCGASGLLDFNHGRVGLSGCVERGSNSSGVGGEVACVVRQSRRRGDSVREAGDDGFISALATGVPSGASVTVARTTMSVSVAGSRTIAVL